MSIKIKVVKKGKVKRVSVVYVATGTEYETMTLDLGLFNEAGCLELQKVMFAAARDLQP